VESQEVDPGESEIRVEWIAIEHAKEYRVQIRNTQKQNIRDLKVKTNYVDIRLAPGEYEQRVGVINKFGRLEEFSGWQKVQILIVKKPEVPKTKPEGVPESAWVPVKGQPLVQTLDGKNFVPDSKIRIRGKSKTLEPSEIIFENSKEIKVIFKEPVPEGIYDLEIINPKGKSTKVPGYVRVFEPEPSIASAEAKKRSFLSANSKQTTISKNQDSDLEEKTKNENPENLAQSGFLVFSEELKNLPEPVWQSALIPGWGQFEMNQSGKGWIHAGLFSAAFLYALNSARQVQIAQAQYQEGIRLTTALQFGGNSVDSGIRLTRIFQDESNYQAYTNRVTEFRTSLLVLLGVYVYQLWDTYSDAKEDRNPTKTGWDFQFGTREIRNVYMPGPGKGGTTEYLMQNQETFSNISWRTVF
jgi:hypothetical protein